MLYFLPPPSACYGSRLPTVRSPITVVADCSNKTSSRPSSEWDHTHPSKTPFPSQQTGNCLPCYYVNMENLICFFFFSFYYRPPEYASRATDGGYLGTRLTRKTLSRSPLPPPRVRHTLHGGTLYGRQTRSGRDSGSTAYHLAFKDGIGPERCLWIRMLDPES